MTRRLIIATVPILAFLWIGIGFSLLEKRRMALESAAGEARNLSRAFDENIVRTIEAIDITIRSIRTARAQDPARFDLNAWLKGTGLPGGLTLQVSFTDRDGRMVQTNLGPITTPTSIADREHFKTTRDRPDDGLFISRPVLGRVSGRWSVQFVRKQFDASGAFDGAIVASLDPAFLSRFHSSLRNGQGALLLLGEDGLVRAAAPDGLASLGADMTATSLLPTGSDAAVGEVRGGLLQDGLDRIYSWRRLKEFGLVVVVGVSTDGALAGFRRDRESWSIAGGVLTLLTLVAGIVLARNRRDLVRSRTILQAAVENISQGLMVIDPERTVPVLNARAVELLNLPPDLAKVGVSFNALLDWQIRTGEFDTPGSERARALAEAGGVSLGTTVYQRTSRSGRVLEIRTQALETGLAVRTFTDISDQERTAHVLEEARDAAEAAARARSEFLATMSHEIRTPLNGVIGVAGLLEDMELGPAQRAYVRLIRESGDHLVQLINDILDFSRLDASQIELEEARFSPRALVAGAIDLFRPQAQMKGLELSAHVDPSVPDAVMGDPGRLRQILLNLVGNATKFTDRGWVRIELAAACESEGRVSLHFAVADSGIGIAAAAVDRIFQEFTQVDGSISRRFGGSGLGLAICRRLVTLLGGGIAVESEPGRGSTFRFDIACRPSGEAAAAEPVVTTEPAAYRRPAAAGAARRGQSHQPPGGDRAAGAAWPPCHGGHRRRRGVGGATHRELRRGADGRHDAADGRSCRDADGPGRGGGRRARDDRRRDRGLAAGGPAGLPRGRHGRGDHQAGHP